MNIAQIKSRIPISEFLLKVGCEPKFKSKGEAFYLSPIRSSDTTPSFAVNDVKGTWYDHGEGQGGNIIALALLLYNTSSVEVAVQNINSLYNGGQCLPDIKFNISDNKNTQKEYHIDLIKNIGNNPALTDYLIFRGVNRVSTTILKEVYYTTIKDGNAKKYFAIGWQNQSGGWDIRNAFIKGCLGKKDITVIQGSNLRLSVFEGMFDYLSALLIEPDRANDTIIILNTGALAKRAFELIDNFKIVDLFLDNDKGGVSKTKLLKSNFPNAIDRSYMYYGFNDYNDKIKFTGNMICRASIQMVTDIMISTDSKKRLFLNMMKSKINGSFIRAANQRRRKPSER